MLEVRRGSRIKSRVRLGLFAFDESFSLHRAEGAPDTISIGLALGLANQLGVVSGSLDRFAVRKLASEIAEQTLTALCEVCAEGQAELGSAP